MADEVKAPAVAATPASDGFDDYKGSVVVAFHALQQTLAENGGGNDEVRAAMDAMETAVNAVRSGKAK